jgi:hypothetical protein
VTDFFISYAEVDQPWAEWIAYVLEEQQLSVKLQAWDFRPGANLVLEMQRATEYADRTIVVLTPSYLSSDLTGPEWAAAFAKDPKGSEHKVVPVMVEECQPPGMLRQMIPIRLLDRDEDEASKVLLAGLDKQRAKPTGRPAFPGHRATGVHPEFPGRSSAPSKETESFAVIATTDIETAVTTAASAPHVDGMFISKLTDFDLIPFKLVVRAQRSDDGTDLKAIIQYRNRSTRHLTLSKPDAGFSLAGKKPDGQMSHGISAALPKEKTDSIQFGTIRVYDDRERQGKAFFSVDFGASVETSRCRMLVQYDFVVRDYPQDKSTDAVVGEDVVENVTYYVKNADD